MYFTVENIYRHLRFNEIYILLSVPLVTNFNSIALPAIKQASSIRSNKHIEYG